MASLTGQKIKDTYQSLLKTDDNGLITNAFKGVTDGSGSASGLYLKNDGVQVNGTLVVSGSLLYSGSTIDATVTSASYALTASYALNGGGGGSTDTGSLLVTASVSSNVITFTKGDATTFNITVNTGSAGGGGTIDSSSFATTGSNTFIGEQTISGSIQISGSIIPATDGISTTSSFSLGSATNAWKDIFVSNGTINFLDGAGNVQAALSSTDQGLQIQNYPADTGSIPVFNVSGSGTFSNGLTISGSLSFGDGSLIQSVSASSGDGYGLTTLQLNPNAIYENDQYIVLDPTFPNHIHIRAGGIMDASTADLYLGGENTNVLVDDGGQRVRVTTTDIEVQFLGYIDNGFGDGSGATLHVADMINGTITDGMTIYGPGIPGGYTLQFGTVIAPQGDGGVGNYYLPGGDFLTTLSVYTGGTITTNNWNFEADGKLNMPGSLEQGQSVLATGSYSHAEGLETQAIGEASHAEGYQTVASGSHSHAEGENTQAIGQSSHAEGAQTIASGSNSHAEGGQTQAIGALSHAEGQVTQAIGAGSHAEGAQTQAIAEASHAEGLETQAIGLASHAEGNQTKTGTQNAYYAQSVVNGIVTLSGSYGDVASQFGANNRLYLYDAPFDANYNRQIYIISQSYFDSTNTIVELYDTGINTTTAYVGDLDQELATWIGDQTIPGDYAHTEGGETQAIGNYTHAEGYQTNASGLYSHAEGQNTLSIGLRSHAEGDVTKAVGDSSHAEGENTQAIGLASHAEGSATQAIGDYSHAEGSGTEAIGSYSHAEGSGSLALGIASHAEGNQTKTGTQNAYYAQSVVNGVVTLSSSYGDATNDFTSNNRLFLDDTPFDNTYGDYNYLISRSYFDSTNTIVELYDTSITTTTAYVGDLYRLRLFNGNWSGDQILSAPYSHTEGTNTVALAYASHAEGTYSQAIGNGSHAEGFHTQAIGYNSHAEGDQTQTIGDGSHAEGQETIASGSYSHAEGNITTAVGDYSHAEGDNTQAIGNYSHAEGQETIALGQYSHAEGSNTDAIGNWSHAEGLQTKTGTQNAYYAQSVVNGIVTLSGSYGDVASSFVADNRLYLYDNPFDNNYNRTTFIISQSYFDSTNTIVELYDTSVNTTTAYVGDVDYLVNNAWNGDQTIPGTYSHAEGEETQAIGYGTHAEGTVSIAIGFGSHAEGSYTLAVGTTSHAEGNNTKAIGDDSHTEGYQTIALGQSSHAEGYITIASGSYSHAEGDRTVASGSFSHAEGFQTIASGSYSHAEGGYIFDGDPYPGGIAIGLGSHAEGDNTQAIGRASHAEGKGAQSIGLWSHAEGNLTIAAGELSHAEGDSTQAIGVASHAEGIFTIASGSGQHVSGQFNQHNNDTSYFVVGIGLTEETRKDGFTVDVDANGSGSVMIPNNLDAPSVAKTGSMYVDPANNKLWIYTGNGGVGGWVTASLG